MLLSNPDLFITLVVNEIAPINGMYVVYTPKADTPVFSVPDNSSLDNVKELVVSSGGSIGLARVSGVFPQTIASGATTTYYGTTANAEHICGMPLSAGYYARAVMLAHINKHEPEHDTALDYNQLSATVFPANGAITLIDEVTTE